MYKKIISHNQKSILIDGFDNLDNIQILLKMSDENKG